MTQTTRVAVIKIVVPNDVGLALNLYDGIEAFVANSAGGTSCSVSMCWEDESND